MIIELFVVAVVLVVSIAAFSWSRKCLTINTEPISMKDELKSKSKLTKQPLKYKIAKKESNHGKTVSSTTKNTNKTEQKIENVKSNSTKHEAEVKEVVVPAQTSVVDRNRNDSTTEWTKVIKTTKKPKKEPTKTEADNLSNNEDGLKTVRENVLKDAPKSNSSGSNKTKKEIVEKVDLNKETIAVEKTIEKPVDQGKNVKNKKSVTIESELENKENQVKGVNLEVKQKIVSNDGTDLTQKINEMKAEIDKMKENQKDENKSNSQINKEIEALKLKLKASQTNEEKLLEDVRKKGQAVTDLKNQFLIIQSELTKNIVTNQSLSREKMNLEVRARSLEEQMVIMNEKCQQLEQLKIEKEDLLNKLSSVQQEYTSIQAECKEMLKSQEIDLTSQINTLQSDKHRIQDQLVAVQSDFINNSTKLQSIQQDLLTAKTAHTELLNEKLRLQKLCAELEQSAVLKQQELADFDQKSKQHQEQIANLTKQINDTNALNNNLLKQNSDLEQLVDQLRTSQQTENSSAIADLSEKCNGLTQKYNEAKEELKHCAIQLEERNSTIEKHTSQIYELTTEKDRLLGLVDQYKTGLECTESVLSKLQTSVYEEENKWRESLMKSETEAEKSKRELEIVYNDLMRIKNSRAENNELNFAYHCVDKSLSSLIDEMEARMIHFEKSLETVVQERDNALSQISSQINGDSKNHDMNNDDHLHQNESEFEKLKTDLHNQMELNKSLENHCNKYKALIDIGKDALEAEKTRVQELQEQLKSLQSSQSNVPNEISSSNSS